MSTEYGAVPAPKASHAARGYGAGAGVNDTDFAPTSGNIPDSSPLSASLQQQSAMGTGRFNEDFDARTRGSSVLEEADLPQRSASRASNPGGAAAAQGTPSRSGTLKKRNSVNRSGSLKKSASRKSLRAGSIKGLSISDDPTLYDGNAQNSVFFTPVPTSGSPTEVLANRFQAWRKLLKDLITYFREVQNSYEQRSKSLLKVSNVINNLDAPSLFLTEGGLNDANRFLRDYHKQSISEANKAKDIEQEVIAQLNGLRGDLASKIKEIKSLSGDFKNSVEKEKEGSRKAVAHLEEALSSVDTDPSSVSGKGDPYVIRLAVDRQIERQIDEENYLHRAYLNLEGSGRELESIVVGEIQKAYNALASIMKRDADEAYNTVEKLRNGPIAMPKDREWSEFVRTDQHFVDPSVPMRSLEDIEYPGKHHPAAAEVRAGMLERKSKFLKSYTPGWYVLSPTHLHEFKSADRIYTQPPVMSLYLLDQKLGTHSQPGSSSHKFILKGRQTGSMHRGHSWVFRAETYETMLAWYDDIKALSEKSGEERNMYVRRHARSYSQGSARSVTSVSDLDEEDEADQVPYSASQSMASQQDVKPPPQRPSGGRFPSDLNVNRHLQVPLSPSSGSSEVDHDLTTASGGFYDHADGQHDATGGSYYQQYDDNAPRQTAPLAHNEALQQAATHTAQNQQSFSLPPPSALQQTDNANAPSTYNPNQAPFSAQQPQVNPIYAPVPVQPTTSTSHLRKISDPPIRHNSHYGDWMAPAAGGAMVGAAGATAYQQSQRQQQQEQPNTAPVLERAPPTQDPAKMVTGPEQGQGAGTEAFPSFENSDMPPPSHIPVAIPAPYHSSTTASTAAATQAQHRSLELPREPAGGISSTSSVLSDDTIPTDLSSVVGKEGGIKGEGGEEVFPGMKRMDTDVSVSDLHVPGEYPRRGVGSPI